jgi:hypothetical protein
MGKYYVNTRYCWGKSRDWGGRIITEFLGEWGRNADLNCSAYCQMTGLTWTALKVWFPLPDGYWIERLSASIWVYVSCLPKRQTKLLFIKYKYFVILTKFSEGQEMLDLVLKSKSLTEIEITYFGNLRFYFVIITIQAKQCTLLY